VGFNCHCAVMFSASFVLKILLSTILAEGHGCML
jgi:hypothetical protein